MLMKGASKKLECAHDSAYLRQVILKILGVMLPWPRPLFHPFHKF